jgi:hypothetical protein
MISAYGYETPKLPKFIYKFPINRGGSEGDETQFYLSVSSKYDGIKGVRQRIPPSWISG